MTEVAGGNKKRELPKNRLGIKNDWAAIETLQEEINKTAQDAEKGFIKERQKRYQESLNQEMQWANKKKEAERRARMMERKDMSEQVRRFNDNERRVFDNKKKEQGQVSNVLENQMNERRHKANEMRQKDRQDEAQRLKKIQDDLNKERDLRMKARQSQLAEERNFFQEKQAKQMEDKRSNFEQRTRDKEVIAMNIKREEAKEEQYRRYYQQKDQEQAKLVEQFQNRVYDAELKAKESRERKQREVNDRYNKQMEQAYYAEQQKRQQFAMNTKETLQKQLSDKERVKQAEYQERKNRVEQSLRQSQNERELDRQLRNQKRDEMRAYSELLAKQMEEQRKRQVEEQMRMPRGLKQVNKGNIKAYKYADGGSQSPTSMIPGFGVSDHVKILEKVQNGGIRKTHMNKSISIGPGSPSGTRASGFNNKSHDFSTSMSAKMYSLSRDSSGKDLLEARQTKEQKLIERQFNEARAYNGTIPQRSSVMASHNPITNPISDFNQNPYLNTAAQKMFGKPKGVFTSTASNILG